MPSAAMLRIAACNSPESRLFLQDFSDPLPNEQSSNIYQIIAIHHTRGWCRNGAKPRFWAKNRGRWCTRTGDGAPSSILIFEFGDMKGPGTPLNPENSGFTAET